MSRIEATIPFEALYHQAENAMLAVRTLDVRYSKAEMQPRKGSRVPGLQAGGRSRGAFYLEHWGQA